jgi:hypothetical protein
MASLVAGAHISLTHRGNPSMFSNPKSPLPPLSTLFADAGLVAVFARAESCPVDTFAVPVPPPVPPAGSASLRPWRATGDGALPSSFDHHLTRFWTAANVAFDLAHHRVPIADVLRGQTAAARDPRLAADLLEVVTEGHEIAEALLAMLAAVRAQLEAVR